MAIESRWEAPAGPPRRLDHLLGFIIAIGPVSVDMYLPAFPTIGAEFGRSAAQLTLTAYLVGLAAGQMPWGLLADRFGRRRPLAAGIVLYTLASILCACVPAHPSDIALFCFFRLLAGGGAAASIVIPRTMVRDLYDGPQADAFLSRILRTMSFAPIVAPAIGALVFSAASSPGVWIANWRAIFVVAAAYGIVSLVLVLRFVGETWPPERRIAIGPRQIAGLYRTILPERGFLSNALVGSFVMCAMFAYLAGLPKVFMVEYPHKALTFGAIQAVLSLGIWYSFKLNTCLVRKVCRSRVIDVLEARLVGGGGGPRVINLGILIWLAAGACLTILAWSPQGAIPFFLGLLLFGLGYSFIPGNAQVAAVKRHDRHAGTATALMSTMQYCSGAVAGALVGALADGTARPMAGIMLACAFGAAIAACLRPRAAVETPAAPG
jgi:DHA1 family bicyclomycin/chloramphenicol resistance-like MFS transporter